MSQTHHEGRGDDEKIETAADAELALKVRVAWLYYIEQLTQSEIAEDLGLTRFKANRILAECRAEGHVRVAVTAPLASCVALEQKACKTFDLSEAVIVPSPTRAERMPAMIGAGLARFVARRLDDPQVKTLGIGWGSTMREMLRHLRPVERPDVKIVTLLGALPKSSEESSIEIIGTLGRMLGAERHYITAPIYADTPDARDIMVSQSFYTPIHDLILESDIACFAAGDVSPNSVLVAQGLPSAIELEKLIEQGAVGDIMGTFINIEGAAIDHPINHQRIGPDFEELKQLKSIVLASGGADKIDIITGALRSGMIDVLVCDEDTITTIMECW